MLKRGVQAQWAGLLAAVMVVTGLAALAGCGGSSERGAQLYAMENCAICHGKERQGSKLAPPLSGLSAHWTAEQLVRDYFPDPVSHQRNDPRLREMLKTYNTMKMPPVRLPEKDLWALAEWLIQTDPGPVAAQP